MKSYQRVIEKVLRPGTRRRQYYELGLTGVHVILNEGWSSFWFRFKKRLEQYLRPHLGFIWRSNQYQCWLDCNEPKPEDLEAYKIESQSFQYQPKISILTPVWNTDKRWVEQAINSVLNQVYDNWELCLVDDGSTQPYIKQILNDYASKDERIKTKLLMENIGIAGASNQALSLASGEFVGFLDHDDELRPNALYEVVKLLNRDLSLDLIYSDEDRIDTYGNRTQPFFKPDWSPDLLMSMNYVCHFTVIRKNIVDNLGGFRREYEGSQDYDLILRVTEKSHKIAHISKPLYGWRVIPSSMAASFGAKPHAFDAAIRALDDSLYRRGVSGHSIQFTPGRYRIKYTIKDEPLVSIIIPTRDNYKKLARCVNSIESKTIYKNYELIVVDHDSKDSKTISYLTASRHKVLKYTGKFNFSRMNNLGVNAARGEHIIFLNDDTEVIKPDWLSAMLEHSQRQEIGMVGALLLYGRDSHVTGKIQHAGAILGMGVAGHAFKHTSVSNFDYISLHSVIRNCSAVTAACAMMRKDLFLKIGGFDENLPVAFNDIDLCLHLREKGYLITYTPFSVLYHDEGGTRGPGHPAEDETIMLSRWADVISTGDPYYNRNLTLMQEDFSLPPRPSANIPLPLAVLLEIYCRRVDIQHKFPEVIQGKYENLIDWAVEYGLTVDTYRWICRPYCKWYVENASETIKPLAVLLQIYNFNDGLQTQFPEVLKHDFTRLFVWAYEVSADNSNSINVDVERLLPYRYYYKSRLNQ